MINELKKLDKQLVAANCLGALTCFLLYIAIFRSTTNPWPFLLAVFWSGQMIYVISLSLRRTALGGLHIRQLERAVLERGIFHLHDRDVLDIDTGFWKAVREEVYAEADEVAAGNAPDDWFAKPHAWLSFVWNLISGLLTVAFAAFIASI